MLLDFSFFRKLFGMVPPPLDVHINLGSLRTENIRRRVVTSPSRRVPPLAGSRIKSFGIQRTTQPRDLHHGGATCRIGGVDGFQSGLHQS